jgi:hypothetical protein
MCTATSWVSFCTSMHLASLHKCNRPLQFQPLGPLCLSSPLPILHVSISQEDSNWWLDVNGWNLSMCNRYRYAVLLLPTVWLWPYLNWNVIRLTPSFFYYCWNFCALKLCMQILDTSHNHQFRYEMSLLQLTRTWCMFCTKWESCSLLYYFYISWALPLWQAMQLLCIFNANLDLQIHLFPICSLLYDFIFYG